MLGHQICLSSMATGEPGFLKKVMARASGGCARAIGNPASGGAPGQAALYIGALHITL